MNALFVYILVTSFQLIISPATAESAHTTHTAHAWRHTRIHTSLLLVSLLLTGKAAQVIGKG